MDCYFAAYIPTEAKTPSPDEINKLQLQSQSRTGVTIPDDVRVELLFALPTT